MENNRLFCYGILKRGYELDLAHFGAKFLGEAHINGATLYGIGPKIVHEGHPNDGEQFHGVGLRFTENADSVAHGELWEIPDPLWKWLDGIERNGYCYTRKIVPVHLEGGEVVDAYVYEHCYPGFSYENLIKGGRF